MIDVLHGQVLHSYYLKIEVESPDGILETQVRPVVSQHNLFTLHGQEGLSRVTQETFEQIRSHSPKFLNTKKELTSKEKKICIT